MKKQKQTKEQKHPAKGEFERFELLNKNLLSVSNAEVRQRMEEEKCRKKSTKDKQ